MQHSGHTEEVVCPRFQRASGQADVPSTPGPSTLRGLGEEAWMGVRVNRLRVKEAPEKELRDRSLQPGPLAHLHLGCPARRAFSELSPARMAGGHGGRGGGTGVRLSTNWT